MDAVIITVVVIGALLVIASGIWVAVSLISAISTRRATSPVQPNANNNEDTENYNQ